MLSLPRSYLLVLCLVVVLSVAVGYDVHWSIYDDQNCTNLVTSGSDYNAEFGNLGWGRLVYFSTTCIQLPASISGVRSAHAACGDIDLGGSGTDVLDTILQVYTDTNCATPANITNIGSLIWGGCSATTSQYWFGPLSARVNCNLPTSISSSSSSSSGSSSGIGSSSSSSSTSGGLSSSTSQGGNYATSTVTSTGGTSSAGGNTDNTYHTSSSTSTATSADTTNSKYPSSTGTSSSGAGSTGSGSIDSKSGAATAGGNKNANDTDYTSSTGPVIGGGVIRYNAASRITAPLSLILLTLLLAAFVL